MAPPPCEVAEAQDGAEVAGGDALEGKHRPLWRCPFPTAERDSVPPCWAEARKPSREAGAAAAAQRWLEQDAVEAPKVQTEPTQAPPKRHRSDAMAAEGVRHRLLA